VAATRGVTRPSPEEGLSVERVRGGKRAECWFYDEDPRQVDEFLA